MKSVRMIISIPFPLKVQLDRLRAQGTSASGFIRYLLQEHFDASKTAKKRR
jgi:hypothetical protein